MMRRDRAQQRPGRCLAGRACQIRVERSARWRGGLPWTSQSLLCRGGVWNHLFPILESGRDSVPFAEFASVLAWTKVSQYVMEDITLGRMLAVRSKVVGDMLKCLVARVMVQMSKQVLRRRHGTSSAPCPPEQDARASVAFLQRVTDLDAKGTIISIDGGAAYDLTSGKAMLEALVAMEKKSGSNHSPAYRTCAGIGSSTAKRHAPWLSPLHQDDWHRRPCSKSDGGPHHEDLQAKKHVHGSSLILVCGTRRQLPRKANMYLLLPTSLRAQHRTDSRNKILQGSWTTQDRIPDMGLVTCASDI